MASKLEDQARKVLASLEAKPGLLFELLRIAADEYMVLGPWSPIKDHNTGDFHYQRRTADGEPVGSVARVPNDPQKWQWQTKGGSIGGSTLTGAGGAQQLADSELESLGWVLA